MSDYISDDLIAKIFERLPPKTLIRCTSLSKSWASRIASPHFIRQQTLHSTTTPRKIIFRNDVIENRVPVGTFWTLHSESELPFQVQGYVGIPRINGPSDLGWTVGSSNGLVCLYDSREESFVLWNPIIRHKLTVPDSELDGDELCGFGFDEVANDYKIVTISEKKNEKGERERSVYNLSTGTWHAISSSPGQYVSIDSSGSFVNGSFYWVVFSWVNEPKMDTVQFLVSFDFGNEVFNSIQLPESNAVLAATIQVLDIKGALAVISFVHRRQDGRIWIRKDETWSFVYQVNDAEPRIPIKVIPLTTDDDFLFLFVNREGLYLYNLVTGVRSRIAESGPETNVNDMETYVESIQLLDKGAPFR